MPSNPYPTLSTQGFVRSPQAKAKWIFSDYIASKYSQSTIFYGQIKSITYDEYHGQFDPDITAEQVRASLEDLYNGYFDQVTIEVTDVSGDDTVASIAIYALLVDGTEEVKLNEVLKFTNGVLDKIKK